MFMRNVFIVVCMLFSACKLFSQQLSRNLNLLRPGDVMNVKEIPFITADSVGLGVVWDFSNVDVNSCKNSYQERIYLDIDSVLHYSTPYADKQYALKGDTLFCTGYTAKNIQANHILADAERIFPVFYGDSVESAFYSEGFYSQKLHFVGYGHTHRKIIATGRLILPEVDTLRNVLLLYENSVLGQRLSAHGDIKSYGKSRCHAADSIINALEKDSIKWQVEIWSWYAAGYRYPILKSTRNTIIERDSKRVHFEKSYFYPPEEWEFASQDKDNEEEKIRIEAENDYWDEIAEINIPINYTYSIQGNLLEITLELEAAAEIELIAATHEGYVLARTPRETIPAGTIYRQLDVSSAQPGIFIFTAIVNGRAKSSKIIKP